MILLILSLFDLASLVNMPVAFKNKLQKNICNITLGDDDDGTHNKLYT